MVAMVLLQLSNGDAVCVEGDLESVERTLSDAARSGSRLAWFNDGNNGEAVAVNPEHVVVLRPREPT
jgi:hypothetical protein